MKKKFFCVLLAAFMMINMIFASGGTALAAEGDVDYGNAYHKIKAPTVTVEVTNGLNFVDIKDLVDLEGNYQVKNYSQVRLNIAWEALYTNVTDGDNLLKEGDTFKFVIEEINNSKVPGQGFGLVFDTADKSFPLYDGSNNKIAEFTIKTDDKTGTTTIEITILELPAGEDPNSPYVVRGGSVSAEGKIIGNGLDSGLVINGNAILDGGNIQTPEKQPVEDTGANPYDNSTKISKEGVFYEKEGYTSWTINLGVDYNISLYNGRKDENGKITNARAKMYMEDELTYNQTIDSISIQHIMRVFATTDKDGNELDYEERNVDNGGIGAYSDRQYAWYALYTEDKTNGADTRGIFDKIEYHKDSTETLKLNDNYSFATGLSYDEFKAAFLENVDRQSIVLYREKDTNGLDKTTMIVYFGDLGDKDPSSDSYVGAKFTDLPAVKAQEPTNGDSKFLAYLKTLTYEKEENGTKVKYRYYTDEQAKYLDKELAAVDYVIPAYRVNFKARFPEGMAEGAEYTNQAHLYWNNNSEQSNEIKLSFSEYSGTIIGGAKGSAGLYKYDLATKDDEKPQTIANAEFELYKVANGTTPSSSDELIVKKATNSWGMITVSGLEDGYYYWKEVKAAPNYSMNGAVYQHNGVESNEPIVFEVIEQANAQKVVYTTVYNQKIYTGGVELTKYDLDSNETTTLEGAEFDLYLVDNNGDTKMNSTPYTTNMYGEIEVNDLLEGSYYFKEVKAPSGYELDDKHIPFTISKDDKATMQVKAYNKKIPPHTEDVQLIKYDADTNESVTLEGAEFDLYVVDATNGDTKVNATPYVTDKDGKITVEDLLEGSYYFKEVKAPNGYDLDDAKVMFEIDENTNTKVIVKAYNTKTPPNVADVELIKYDTDSNETITLEGAKFYLYVVDEKGNATKVNDEVYTTNADGRIEVKDLPEGSYYFKEVGAPEGYVLDATNVEFEVTKDTTGVIVVKAYNAKKVEDPKETPPTPEKPEDPFTELPSTSPVKELDVIPSVKTGDVSATNALLACVMMSGFVICLLFARKKLQKK
ncbi:MULTISPECIES: SpaA isopeptide-forming pilin-related protein [unclassified Breznakia]|uniref:SpaA isopeptide-forming pilin-related protein n=1 Tax=unclassified Breznakia TaxID=2623764 RepID=UPI0024767F0D|nr:MULTISPECIES: SpaA isopeptide-forming pilin-related protein [unclassified Breznakia]MDH6365951.1 hypothetical protein [Breznakia sp. PH1-1]MDH6403117.1 hypothetical protein [Breznakia sp. PF1-11]MDH6410826.1 hypothetical protein [Breznakia sp. PFB1-11]MDH6413117.1 hypothetical protein [Breznakia sp. PFB1-14]MDH6415485.1 hypothetical protein [Breznakia sp. PFB1-4]